MEAENLAIDQGRKGKVVEQIGEILPDIGIAVLSQAFVIKSVDLCDLTGFVVTTQDGDSFTVSYLECKQETVNEQLKPIVLDNSLTNI